MYWRGRYCFLIGMNYDVRTTRPGRPAFKWLILLGLLWVQFAYADHRLSHDTVDLREPCQYCIGFDRFDDTAIDAVVVDETQVFLHSLSPCSASVSCKDHLQLFGARAPPHSQ